MTQQPQSSQVRWEWIGEGWSMFAAQPKVWIIDGLIFFLTLIIPLIAFYAVFVAAMIAAESRQPPEPPLELFLLFAVAYLFIWLASVFLMGGAFNTAFKQLRGEQIRVSDLFSGGEHFLSMLFAGLLIGFLAMLGMLLCFIPGLIVVGLYFFTLPLIVERRMGLFGAMKESFAVTSQSLLMFTVFTLVTYLIASAGTYVCYIGMIVTWPLLFTISAVAYRDCFGLKGALSFARRAQAPQPWELPPPVYEAAPPASFASPQQPPPRTTCPQCGVPVPQTARFCNHCGYSLN